MPERTVTASAARRKATASGKKGADAGAFDPPCRTKAQGARLRRQEAEAQEAAAKAFNTARARRRPPSPVPAPGATSSWQEELWRLRRLYASAGCTGAEAFEVIADGAVGDAAEEECGNSTSSDTISTPAKVRLVLNCTDPDWEAVNWAPYGLLLEITVPATYPEPPLQFPSLRVVYPSEILGPPKVPQRFVQLLPKLFAEFVERVAPRTPAVYRGLQHLDRFATKLYLKVREVEEREAEEAEQVRREEEAKRAREERELNAEPSAADAESAGSGEEYDDSRPWTDKEHAELEEALEEFTAEMQPDTQKRFAMIALRVGNEHSPWECAERCWDYGLEEICLSDFEGEDEEDEEYIAGFDEEEGEDGGATCSQNKAVAATSWNAADVRRLGVEVRLLGLCLEGFDTLMPSILRVQTVCTRCKKPCDLETEAGKGVEPRNAESSCPVCKQVIALRVAPSICHGGCPTIAHVLGVNCQPIQMLRSDFDAHCGECTETAKIRNVGPGYRKRGECMNCFKKCNLAVEGAELLGNAVAQWREMAASTGERHNARRQLHEARQHEKEIGIRVGQPLPNNGTCKHYSKSYRWLRFPCCGRAFPCDTCHDDQMDHPHEWANRMLCGRCSHEQPFTKDSCAHCGAAQTRSRSAFWEGGEGCRSRTTMAKNDHHKYKGLSKCLSSKVAQRVAKSGRGCRLGD